jgi:choline dehydrogenase-like flavoprotein
MDVELNRRSFLAGMAGMVAEAFPHTSNGRSADQTTASISPTGRFGDIDSNTIFDVCIIGSGFAGAILGESLVRQGIKTVILESGPDPRGKSLDPRFQQLDAFRSTGPIKYPVASTRFRGVGGTSWLWGGFCTRLFPIDFEKNSYTPAGISWPITYADLEPYYDYAEKTLRVRGRKQSEHDPPRKNDFPLPADRAIAPLESLLEKVGIVISDVPFATPLTRDSSILNGHYGPFLHMTETHLPNFQASSHGALIPEVTVSRLLVDEQGRVSGAEIKNLDRHVKILRARAYVVACGGLESPRLLLLSRGPRFPDGIGNNYGWVGRCFMEHRKTLFTGQVNLGWNSFNLFQITGFSYQFYKKFKQRGLGGMRLRFRLDGLARWKEIYDGNLGKFIDRILSRPLEISFGAEMKPSPENRVTLDKEAKDYFGNPASNLFLKESNEDVNTITQGKEIVRDIYRRLGAQKVQALLGNMWGHHHMGTCRMGDNPRTSVVDRNLQVHGTSNLFVAGSAVFVTSGSANPTLTLSALSLRLADYLRGQLRRGAFSVPYGNRREALPSRM